MLTADQRAALDRISRLGDDREEVVSLAVDCAEVLDGYWSVDLLATAYGWYVTDCAPGDSSWRWDAEEESGPDGNLLYE